MSNGNKKKITKTCEALVNDRACSRIQTVGEYCMQHFKMLNNLKKRADMIDIDGPLETIKSELLEQILPGYQCGDEFTFDGSRYLIGPSYGDWTDLEEIE